MIPCDHPNSLELNPYRGQKPKKEHADRGHWYWCPECGAVRFLPKGGDMEKWRKPAMVLWQPALEESKKARDVFRRCRKLVKHLVSVATQTRKTSLDEARGLERALDLLKKAMKV